MVNTVTVQQDESGEVVVPMVESVLDRLGIAIGDSLQVMTANGAILLRPVERSIAGAVPAQ